jgi:hypothetical protein
MEDAHDLGTGIMVITIVCDNAKLAPEVHLDNCPPVLATTIMEMAIESLRATMPMPTIYYRGEKIAESIYMLDDDDDDDE